MVFSRIAMFCWQAMFDAKSFHIFSFPIFKSLLIADVEHSRSFSTWHISKNYSFSRPFIYSSRSLPACHFHQTDLVFCASRSVKLNVRAKIKVGWGREPGGDGAREGWKIMSTLAILTQWNWLSTVKTSDVEEVLMRASYDCHRKAPKHVWFSPKERVRPIKNF